MKYAGLYHLNAYTYADPTWFPDMPDDLRAMFQKVTKGAMSGKAGETGSRRLQDQRPVRRHAGDRRQGRRRRHSLLRRLRREGGDRIPRRSRQDAERAVLHQRELHEGSPAEHAGAGVRAQVAVEVEICRLGRRARHPHRPDHGQAARNRHGPEHAGFLHDRQRRLAGRLSRRRLYAVPRHQGHAARRRQPRSRDRGLAGQDQAGLQEPRDHRRPRPDGDIRLGRRASSFPRTTAKASRSSSTAST